MGELRNKRIVQSRIYLDGLSTPVPPYDYDFSYPITVYEAVKRSMDSTSTNLEEELESIYRLINGKQDEIDPGTPGQLMTWTGMRGQIGTMEVVKSINTDPSQRSHQKVPSERAIGDSLDTKVSLSDFTSHITDNTIHITDVERNRWNSMAPLSSLQSHIGNTTLHITEAERGRWNAKANQTEVDEHIYNTDNPHNVTAHQVGTYTRREIDEMFTNIRDSFFNYMNISWDERSNQASLVEYHPANWNPNFILGFSDMLPDVPDPTLTYFALKPATDYQSNETADCIIYCKRPGLAWQEVGFQSMKAGDLVIKYPETTMYVWVQGRFMQLFTDSSVESGDVSLDGNSDNMWRPSLNEKGELIWTKSKSTEPPPPMYIKGEDGYTPIKGVDYDDGKDGQGVPIGGAAGTILVKLTDENYDATWKSLLDVLGDLVLAGGSLPDGVVNWNEIKGRPEWYDELGDNTDGFITQRAATRQFGVVNNQITQILEKLDGPNGLDQTKETLYDHINDFNNPHRVTPAIIGAVSNQTFLDHAQNFNNPHNVTAAQIGLGNVNNTADIDKPISNATQEAIDKILLNIGNITSEVGKFNYVSNVTWTDTSTTLTFIFRDGTEMDVEIPINDIFSSIYFDDKEFELVIILPDGTERRVNVEGLIKSYFGSVSDNIQVTIEENNVIKATVVPGTIGELEITPSVHLRGSPTTMTQPASDKSTRIATTEFVRNQVIDNLISYETDRALSANMGRILNQRKADIEDVIEIINDMEGIQVIDNLESTSPMAALSANMGRYLDLTKAPRVHTSPSGSTFGRATISLFGHARASDIDPLMDGTVFRGTDDGYFARADHRHPTDVSRAPIHFPDVAHDQYSFTGEPRSTLPPDDSNDSRIATTEWIRRNAVGVSMGECDTSGAELTKIVTLRSDFMTDPVFIRQTGSTVAVTFSEDDTSSGWTEGEYKTVLMNVHNTGAARVLYGGMPIITGMIKANHTYMFTFDGTNWKLHNPSGIHTLPDDDNSNSFVSSEWVRRNVVGVSKGESETSGGNPNKVASLRSTFMDPVVFMRQIGTAVAITFTNEDRSGTTPTTLNVQDSGAARILFAGAPVTNGMIGKNHTHMFVFDGENWRLINPVPGTGIGGPDGITIGPGGGDGDDDDEDERTLNRNAGHSGFTCAGDGETDANGQVNRVWFTINFSPKATDVEVKFSDHEDAWGAQMGDGTMIKIDSPKVISTTRSNCVVQFNMETFYPSNSPCTLVYRTNKAYINIKEI